MIGRSLVRLDAPYFVHRPDAVYQRLQGQAITLPCSADGDPPPTLTWRKVSRQYYKLILIIVIFIIYRPIKRNDGANSGGSSNLISWGRGQWGPDPIVREALGDASKLLLHSPLHVFSV